MDERIHKYDFLKDALGYERKCSTNDIHPTRKEKYANSKNQFRTFISGKGRGFKRRR
jgi:hypothetical protein